MGVVALATEVDAVRGEAGVPGQFGHNHLLQLAPLGAGVHDRLLAEALEIADILAHLQLRLFFILGHDAISRGDTARGVSLWYIMSI